MEILTPPRATVKQIALRGAQAAQALISCPSVGKPTSSPIFSTMVIPPDVINQIRAEDARRFKVIPVAFGESGLIVAVERSARYRHDRQPELPAATRDRTGLREPGKNP